MQKGLLLRQEVKEENILKNFERITFICYIYFNWILYKFW